MRFFKYVHMFLFTDALYKKSLSLARRFCFWKKIPNTCCQKWEGIYILKNCLSLRNFLAVCDAIDFKEFD